MQLRVSAGAEKPSGWKEGTSFRQGTSTAGGCQRRPLTCCVLCGREKWAEPSPDWLWLRVVAAALVDALARAASFGPELQPARGERRRVGVGLKHVLIRLSGGG